MEEPREPAKKTKESVKEAKVTKDPVEGEQSGPVVVEDEMEEEESIIQPTNRYKPIVLDISSEEDEVPKNNFNFKALKVITQNSPQDIVWDGIDFLASPWQ